MRKISLVGQKFGRLYVVADGPVVDHRTTSVCRCDCGRPGMLIIRNKELKNGHTKSCGCLKAERSSELGKRTGKVNVPKAQARAKVANRTHGMTKTRLYHIFQQMHQRCENPKNDAFEHYGARGIAVAPEWATFEPFRDWAMANGYSDAMTIDRLNVDKGYCPENCRWVTKHVNSSRIRQGKHRYWCLSEKYGFYAEFDIVTSFLKTHPWIHVKRQKVYDILRRRVEDAGDFAFGKIA